MGGKIESIVWDPTGMRVAITYRSSTPSAGSSSNSGDLTGPLVVIFSVALEPFLIFTRRRVPLFSVILFYDNVGGAQQCCDWFLYLCVFSGLLRGPPNAGLPRKLAFASSFEQGALLSVGWSNGLVTFHPFYFQES